MLAREPKCHQHFELKWISPSELLNLENVPKANRQVVYRLVNDTA